MQVGSTRQVGSELHSWRLFLGRATLWLAVLLLGSGVVCWVAANWPGLAVSSRFALAQGVLAVTVLVGIWLALRLRAAPAQRLQASGAVLTLAGGLLGALLALLGQTYQTGADTWQLFAWWAVLMLPWALMAASQPLWILWCLVFNLALGLWVGEHLLSWWMTGYSMAYPALVMAFANLVLLGVWEAVLRIGHGATRAGPRLLALMALGCLITPLAFGDLFSGGLDQTLLLAWVAVTVGMGLFYQRARRDLVILAMLAAGVICVSMRLVGQWLLELEPGAWAALPLAALLMAEAVWAARWLHRMAHAGSEASTHSEAHPEASASVSPRQAGDAQPLPAGQSLAAAPWYVQGLLGLSAWLATILLLVFLVASGIVRSESSALVTGIFVAAGGVILLRASDVAFWRQCGVAMGFAGQLLMLFSFLNDTSVLTASACVVLMATVVYVGAPDWLLRFLSAGLIAFGLTGLASYFLMPAQREMFDSWLMHDLLDSTFLWLPVAVLGAWATALAFFAERRLPAQRAPVAQPLAWAFLFSVQGMVWLAGGVEAAQLPQLWRLHSLTAVLHVAGAALPAVVAFCLLWPRRAVLTPAVVWVTPLALLGLAIFWLPSPGIAFALAWLLLGFGLDKPRLVIFGIAAGLIYLVQYYYQLEVPLLQKAFWLLTAAALVFALRILVWLLPHLTHTAGQPAGPRAPAAPVVRQRMAVVLGGLVLVLGVCNVTIYQREQVLAQGEVMILELAPVDPRSLMQGDYMALRFGAANFVAEQRDSQRGDAALDGYLVLAKDAEGVARPLRLQAEPTPLAPGEQALRYRVRQDGVRLITNAYFFPEGQGEHFARARYGEIRLDGHGTGLLARMLDAQRQPL
ncbi:membrane protein [Bordetella trematum]|uniref:GDYXXLXY domain-containing protein n=1 Tax=Bordetella trematum TaxID=123899 RepID=UPI00079AE7B8|nr:GDYXXLXY domain-containing protein [Bordetella trematum]QIM70836.1 DUF4401 domain-containing protein [Bordetella trematum]CZZ87667.1 membrane protein [Bordetella trematum]